MFTLTNIRKIFLTTKPEPENSPRARVRLIAAIAAKAKSLKKKWPSVKDSVQERSDCAERPERSGGRPEDGGV